MSDTQLAAALMDLERIAHGGPFGGDAHRRSICAVLAAHDAAVAERDAYKRAKAENDERYMIERDEARAERDALAAAMDHLACTLDTVIEGATLQEAKDALWKSTWEARKMTGAKWPDEWWVPLANEWGALRRGRAENERDALRALLAEYRDYIANEVAMYGHPDDKARLSRIDAALAGGAS